jgi:predicted CXXCH cytochrome family protein
MPNTPPVKSFWESGTLFSKRVLAAGGAVVILFLFSLSNFAQDNSCMTSECHTKIKAMKRLHAPVEEDCTTCHEKTGDHEFKFEDEENLCFNCHDDRKEGKQVHEAIASGECWTCHNPHGGAEEGLLKAERLDKLCFECHDSEEFTKKVIHGPNQSGECNICHDSHSSNNKPLLKKPAEKLCVECHDDKDFSGKGQHKHSAMEDGCTGCHSPHASDHQYQLLNPRDGLCAQCHDDVVEEAGKAAFKHKVVQQEGTCYNCHDPHGSAYEKNLIQSQLKLCLDCHNKPIKGTDGKAYNINKMVTGNKYKHGPVADGECTGCHKPHGSQFYKILNAGFPKSFYTPYSEDKYELCFQCHDSTLAEEETTTDTEFRDGSRNLHYVHVNRKKGRTCRACHEVHAGTLPKQLREDTPFGKWSLPIGFKQAENGGSCAPGCHKPFTYDRTKSADQ